MRAMQGNGKLRRERNCCVKLITDAEEGASFGVIAGTLVAKATSTRLVHKANSHWELFGALFPT